MGAYGTADDRRIAAFGDLTHRGQNNPGARRLDESDELAFIGNEKRVESQDLAGGLNVLANGYRLRVDFDADARRGSDFAKRRSQSAARGIP